MRDIIYHIRKRLYDMYVFTGTNEDDHPWKAHTPAKYVHLCREQFPTTVLASALKVQQERKAVGRHLSATIPPTGFIFEDLEFLTKPIWTVPGVRELWFNGRHMNTYALCAFQYIMEIKMALRGMFDYAFFTMDNSYASRERIRTQFGGVFPSMEMFENIFFACTTNFKAMVLDLRATSYKIEDCVFWYRASDHGPFRVGVHDVWDRVVDEENRKKLKNASRGVVTERVGDRMRMAINLEGYGDADTSSPDLPSPSSMGEKRLIAKKKKKKNMKEKNRKGK